VPLTERGKNNMLLFYTGRKNEDGFPELDSMVKIIDSGSPVIVYMGLNNLVELSEKLMERGVAPSTPIQILSKISQNKQKVFATTVGDVKEFLKKNTPEMPSTIIIGRNLENI